MAHSARSDWYISWDEVLTLAFTASGSVFCGLAELNLAEWFARSDMGAFNQVSLQNIAFRCLGWQRVSTSRAVQDK